MHFILSEEAILIVEEYSSCHSVDNPDERLGSEEHGEKEAAEEGERERERGRSARGREGRGLHCLGGLTG